VSLLLPADMMASLKPGLSLIVVLLTSYLLGSASAPSQHGKLARVQYCC